MGVIAGDTRSFDYNAYAACSKTPFKGSTIGNTLPEGRMLANNETYRTAVFGICTLND